MMEDHQWFGNLSAVAVCPRCQGTSLHRSHAESFFERLRKRYSYRRIFRCNACGWRGWLDESRLRYPAPATERDPFLPVHDNDDIPALRGGQGTPAARTPAPERDPPPTPEAYAAYSIDYSDLLTLPADEHVPDAKSASPSASEPRTEARRREATRAGHTQMEFDPSLAEARPEPLFTAVSENFHRDPYWEGLSCPKCGARALRRSHHKNFYELARKKLTSRRACRCRRCGWRGWITPPYALH